MKGARICTAMLAVAGATACAARHPSRPAVAVLEVRGGGGAEWQERAAELAELRHYEVIPAETYWVMATRLKAVPLTARNVARVAATIGATAVVHGRVTGAKRRRVVTIYVRAGETGRVVEKHRVRLRRARRPRGEAAFERRLLASLPEPVEQSGEAHPRDRRAERDRPAAKASVASRSAKTRPVAKASVAKQPAKTGPPAKASVTRRPAKAQPVAKASVAKRPAKTDPPAKAGRTAGARTDAPPPEPVEYDQRGQAIDDEMPSSLK
jgi:hypothetical protein